MQARYISNGQLLSRVGYVFPDAALQSRMAASRAGVIGWAVGEPNGVTVPNADAGCRWWCADALCLACVVAWARLSPVWAKAGALRSATRAAAMNKGFIIFSCLT